MKIVKPAIVILTMFLLLSTSTFAKETKNVFLNSMSDDENVSLVGTKPSSNVDNSNLNVQIIRVVNGTKTILYEGLLGNYENGLWSNTDFSNIDFLLILEWETMENEAICVIPKKEVSSETTVESEKVTNITNTTTADKTTQTDITSSDSTELIEYDIAYSIISDELLNMNINYNVYNGETENKTVSLIAALYNNGKLCDFKTQELSVTSQNNANESIILPIPENNENYSVKLMVWDSIGGIRPLGKVKRVVDLDNYSREKYLYITSNEDVEFNVFMNASTVKGANNDMIHTLQYDSSKITPTDLCGFTYEKELGVGTIENSNVIIQDANLTDGKIEYRFNLSEGRNTGVTNVIKFKTLSQVENEQILYTIQ